MNILCANFLDKNAYWVRKISLGKIIGGGGGTCPLCPPVPTPMQRNQPTGSHSWQIMKTRNNSFWSFANHGATIRTRGEESYSYLWRRGLRIYITWRKVRTTIESLNSTQEETDTRVVIYVMYDKEQGYKTVKVITPDGDIFFILLHHVDRLEGGNIFFDTGSGNRRKLLIVTKFSRACTEDHRAALLVLHAYCGCDSTSAFKERWHFIPIKTAEATKAHNVTCTVGNLMGCAWRTFQWPLRIHLRHVWQSEV